MKIHLQFFVGALFLLELTSSIVCSMEVINESMQDTIKLRKEELYNKVKHVMCKNENESLEFNEKRFEKMYKFMTSYIEKENEKQMKENEKQMKENEKQIKENEKHMKENEKQIQENKKHRKGKVLELLKYTNKWNESRESFEDVMYALCICLGPLIIGYLAFQFIEKCWLPKYKCRESIGIRIEMPRKLPIKKVYIGKFVKSSDFEDIKRRIAEETTAKVIGGYQLNTSSTSYKSFVLIVQDGDEKKLYGKDLWDGVVCREYDSKKSL